MHALHGYFVGPISIRTCVPHDLRVSPGVCNCKRKNRTYALSAGGARSMNGNDLRPFALVQNAVNQVDARSIIWGPPFGQARAPDHIDSPLGVHEETTVSDDHVGHIFREVLWLGPTFAAVSASAVINEQGEWGCHLPFDESDMNLPVGSDGDVRRDDK